MPGASAFLPRLPRVHRLSLRTTLLLAYAVAMVLVLGAFGFVAQDLYWRTLVRDVDGLLTSRARALARSITRDAEGQFDILVPQEVRGFLLNQPDTYYIVRGPNGEAIDFTAPDLQIPPLAAPGARTRGQAREVAVAGNAGTTIVFGRGLAQAASRYHEFVRTLQIAAIVGLALALVCGWLVVYRALAPIQRISRTAEAMSAENLGVRIDVGRTESELGQVARALNSAFDRLQAAFERQTRFTADASHELRTPLAALISEMEWALRRERTDEEYRQALQTGLRAATRMRGVVEGLLALARADAEQMPFASAPVDLADVVQEVLVATAPLARQRTVSIETDIAPGAVVWGDRSRLLELVTNLVKNAIDYNVPDGRVRIRAVTPEPGDQTTRLDVTDSGIGIAAADLPHIFERFYRADPARSRAAGGSGLGLAIAQWIVDRHGGAIRCDSVYGQGSTFTVHLPSSEAYHAGP